MVSPEASVSTQCLCPSPAGLNSKDMRKKPKKRSRRHQRVLAQRWGPSPSATQAPVPSLLPLPPCPQASFLGRLSPRAASGPRVAAGCVTSPNKCVAIDCEMVGTGPRGRVSELARCSVVSYHGDVLYDKYVRPERPVTDFRSRWSGITQQHLSKAVPFQVARKEVQPGGAGGCAPGDPGPCLPPCWVLRLPEPRPDSHPQVLKLLKGKVVVGHALHNDFQALKYAHPRSHTRDTTCVPSLLSPHGTPTRTRVSLKGLALELLHKKIQVGQHGHSSVEDAATAMQLYRLVEDRWEEQVGGLCAQPEDREGDGSSDMQQFMDDRYWPEDLTPGPGAGGTRVPRGE
ncbi:apoptosis-enhancing nuclease isoform X1 [Sorex araneus]|uniref:apoptosis-enhancing nuclease isoform X1 n=1 Tax=Sorex araneus TaxID=42254 RepID=UPI0024336155|nr:apoptosis-enhancing nuclease isoform X1 [Sorex araneus]